MASELVVKTSESNILSWLTSSEAFLNTVKDDDYSYNNNNNFLICYGSEAWTTRKKDENRVTTSKRRFMCSTAGSQMQWGCASSLYSTLTRTIGRNMYMCSSKIPKAIIHYNPNGRKSLGHPKIWLSFESITGLWPNTCYVEWWGLWKFHGGIALKLRICQLTAVSIPCQKTEIENHPVSTGIMWA